MGNTAEHSESGVFSDFKALAHPWEEVGEAVMSSLDTLRDSCASTGER